MTTTLSEGVKVPDVGSVNWAGDLEVNWNLLNGALANLSGNVKLDRDNTWTGEQSFTLPIVGSIAGTASKAIADEDGTSIKTGYVNVAGNQTVTGDKDWTGINSFVGLTIKDSTTLTNGNYGQALTYRDNQGNRHAYIQPYKNTSGVVNLAIGVDTSGSVQLNSSLIPYAANAISLGSSSYQWSSVYAQSYYYNGTAWGLDKANVWTGTNTFQQNIMYERTNFFHQFVNPSYILKDTGVEKGSLVPTAHTAYPGLWHDKNSAILGYMRFVAYDTGKQTAEIRVSNLIKNGALDPTGSIVNCTVNLELQPSGEKSLIPEQNNDINLGTSTNKWKTLNGVNPGALSLPSDRSNGVEIDRTNWVYDGVTLNKYTPVVDGWLLIRCADAAGNFIFVGSDGKTVSTSGTGLLTSVVFGLNILLPVRANKECEIRINCSGSKTAYLYPCLGNV